MSLRKRERCPLHNSYWCPCHKRAASTLRRGPQPLVEIIEDPHHPAGQREICSPRELRRRKHVLMARDPHCFYCGKLLDDYNDVELAHQNPKGMGGATHDDSNGKSGGFVPSLQLPQRLQVGHTSKVSIPMNHPHDCECAYCEHERERAEELAEQVRADNREWSQARRDRQL